MNNTKSCLFNCKRVKFYISSLQFEDYSTLGWYVGRKDIYKYLLYIDNVGTTYIGIIISSR